MMPLAVLILAAGSSRRMGNSFKPLLPFGKTTVLEHLIQTYQLAGLDDIRVVCGFKADEIKPLAFKYPIKIIENRFYTSGMLSSVKAGIRALKDNIGGFFYPSGRYPPGKAANNNKTGGCFSN